MEIEAGEHVDVQQRPGCKFKNNSYKAYILIDRESGFSFGRFYPCIKYKIPADLKVDGTDHFIVAETMHMRIEGNGRKPDYTEFSCSLSFTCENEQKAFYKLIKDCLRFRIK